MSTEIRDDEVVSLLEGVNTLRDSSLIAISIVGVFGRPDISMEFDAREGSDFSKVKLKFTEVVSFEFSCGEGEAFLDVWDLKFIKLRDGSFYITLDPDPSTLGAAGVTDLDASDTDGFFVRAKHVEAVATEIEGF